MSGQGSFATGGRAASKPGHVHYAPVATQFSIAAKCSDEKQKFTPTVRTACYAPSVHVGAAGTSPSWHNPYKD